MLCFLSLFTLAGCFLHYYKTNSTSNINAETIQNLMNADKYFIFHSNNSAFALTHIKVNDQSLEGDLDELTDEHSKYLNPGAADRNRFFAKFKDTVLYEVHLYASISQPSFSHITIPYKDFTRMDVYSLDKVHTSRSEIASIIGITLITAGVITVIVASVDASKSLNIQPQQTAGTGESTCSPQVYAIDHGQAELNGTLCSGAIYASLKRTDYLPVLKNDTSTTFNLLVKGEKNEELMMSDLKLLEVNHPAGKKVLVDKKGKIFMYENPEAPEHAMIGDGKDISERVSYCDKKYYSFTNETNGQGSDIILDFKKPVGATSGKLIVNGKNSAWSYYVFGQFKKLYGNRYQALIERKDKVDPAKVLQCEIDQQLPLLVSVKYDSGWKYVDYFFTPGNAAPRNMIMQIDLDALKNADHIQVKLQTAYMFWDIDYAGMDFSTDSFFQSLIISPSHLYKSSSTGISYAKEGNNFSTINDNEQLNISYNVQNKNAPGFENSYFLVGSGYYHDHTKYEGKLKLAELARFSGKAAFDKFSREKFEMILTAFDRSKTIRKENISY